MRFLTAAIVVSSALLVACSSAPADPVFDPSGPAGPSGPNGPPPQGTPSTGPTYHKDVEPIVIEHCQQCHVPGGLAPFSLMTYADAFAHARPMVDQTGARTMPPWGAQKSDECTPPFAFKRDPSLTDAQIATIAAWQAAGSPEGDPKDTPNVTRPPKQALHDVDMELAMPAPFVASGNDDVFRCFVLDPQLTTARFLNGIDVIPGNPKVVHHAVLVTDPNGTVAKQAGPDGSFECAAGLGMTAPGQVGLNVWTPGQVPTDLPPNIGTPIAAGSLLILQIHYSPGGVTNDPDQTKVQLRFNKTTPDWVLFTAGIGNFQAQTATGDGLLPGPDDRTATPEFRIPANATAHVETMQLTIPAAQDGKPQTPVYVYGIMAHEHLAGTEVKTTLTKAGQSTPTCLLQDKWDFHWQRMYAYDAPSIEDLPMVAPGDRFTVRCTYNNSMSNVRLATELRARRRDIQDISLGEQTINEMCLGIPQFIVKTPAQ
jgi:hypothetical protein